MKWINNNNKVMLGVIVENYFDLRSCLQKRLQTYSCTFYLSVWACVGVLGNIWLLEFLGNIKFSSMLVKLYLPQAYLRK